MSGYISAELLEHLLWRGESETLDFKRDQYVISGATDAEKAEFVKDVLAFANAWREGDAYILIGVKDTKSGRREVVGVANHPDDADLQQIVNQKTNRPVDFCYFSAVVDDKEIGVLHFKAGQVRPVHLKTRMAALDPKNVYVRRSSSTDVATLDEVSKMGHALRPSVDVPRLELLLESDRTQATQLELVSTILSDPPRVAPNSFAPELALLAASHRLAELSKPDPRKLAAYKKRRALLRPVNFCIKNTGTIALHDVEVQLVIPQSGHLIVSDELPTRPRSILEAAEGIDLSSLHSALRDSFESRGNAFHLRYSIGKVQPGNIGRSSEFYVGSTVEQNLALTAQVYADNLPRPIVVNLGVVIRSETSLVSYEADD